MNKLDSRFVDQTEQSSLTMLLHPSSEGWKDIYKAGWKPAFFNQQWGGSQWGQLPDGSFGDIATGYIDNNNFLELGNISTKEKRAQAFKVSENLTVSKLFFVISKEQSPTDNISLEIYSDNAGLPNTLITNGAADIVSSKLISSNFNWVEFTFSVSPSLVANTTYHIVLSRSGAVDATNYYRLYVNNVDPKYPHGFGSTYNGTVWASPGTYQLSHFLLVAESSNQFLQKDTTNGISSAKLVCNEGTPLNQSKALTNKLRNFLNQEEFSVMIRGKNFTKDKTIVDFTYGLDHDRVVLRSNITTGFPQVDLYESDGTKHTITGTTDISSGSTYDIGFKVRAKNDGSDYLYLYVNGISEGTPLTSQSFSFDNNFSKLGTAWIGGGFPLALASYSENLDMSSLPSANGWTYSGTVSEANAVSIQNGKMYQNASELSTGTGYYQKTLAGFVQTTGFSIQLKVKVTSDQESLIQRNIAMVGIFNSGFTKQAGIVPRGYFMETRHNEPYIYPQPIDYENNEHVILITCKDSNILIYMNGELIDDGTGKLDTGATLDTARLLAWEFPAPDVIYDYIRFDNTGAFNIQASSCEIYEFGCWSGDKSNIFSSLYNSGTRKSIKDFCGIKNDYVKDIKNIKHLRGIDVFVTTSTLPVIIDDLENFILASEINIEATVSPYNPTITGSTFVLGCYLDGKVIQESNTSWPNDGTVNRVEQGLVSTSIQLSTGLHKIDVKGQVSSGTFRSSPQYRYLRLEES